MQRRQPENPSGYRLTVDDLESIGLLSVDECPIGHEADWLDEVIRAAEEAETLLWNGDGDMPRLIEVRNRLRQTLQEMKAIAAQVGVYPQNRHWFLK